MPVNLTETAINKAAREASMSGNRQELADAGCPGLRLRLTPSGTKSWVLACRDREGRMRRFGLGTFPDTGISDARKQARALHTKVKQEGADPVAQRRRELAAGKAAKEGIGTLQSLLNLYGKHRGAELRTWAEAKRRVEVVFKPFLTRPLSTLRVSDIQMAADDHPAKQAASAAVRYLRPILKWGSTRGYVGTEVAALHSPAAVRRRHRVLTDSELKALLPVLRRSRRPYAAALKFMLLTLARRDEVGRARWSDVDLTGRTWTIPETKNGQPHVVLLANQVITSLQSRRDDHATPATLVFATGTGRPLRNWDRETKALQKASGTADWTRHDLRRTGATMLGEMGELPDIIEAALNHVSIRSPLAATYNRSRYRPQVAAALQRLADALDAIEARGETDQEGRPSGAGGAAG